MCLLTPKGTRKIATEDIHVFKIVKRLDDKDRWDGPCYPAGFFFDEVAEVSSPEEQDLEEVGKKHDHVVCGKGFLHSFLKYKDAKNELQLMRILRPKLKRRLRLTKAIIPKGSIYYLSSPKYIYQNRPAMAASNKLVVTRPKGYHWQD